MGKRKGDDVLVGTQSMATALASDTGEGTLVSPSLTATAASYGTESRTRRQVSPTGRSCSNYDDIHMNRSHSESPAWLDSASFDHKLWVVRESLKFEDSDSDDFVTQVEQCRKTVSYTQHQCNSMSSKSRDIQDDLTHQISTDEDQCEAESKTTLNIEEALSKKLSEREEIVESLSNMERLRGDLRDSIESAVREVNKQVESIGSVEETRKNQVPRLKHQISMYATTTGIKWDYYDEVGLEQGNILEGHVVSTL